MIGDATQTFQQAIVIFGLIGSAVTFLFAKPTVDSLIRLSDHWAKRHREKHQLWVERHDADRREAIEEEERKSRLQALHEEQNDKGHKLVIRLQDRRIGELEEAVVKSQLDHHQCREEYVALKCENESLRNEARELREMVESLSCRIERLERGDNGYPINSV